MPPRPTTRPTTEPERALVERVVRAQRSAYAGFAVSLAVAGLVVSALILSASPGGGNTAAAVATAAVFASLAGGVWLAYEKLERTELTAPGTAVAVEGRYATDAVPAGRHRGRTRTLVGDDEVALPSLWTEYLSEGDRYAVWVVQTTRVPIAVAVERGPSADAEAAIGEPLGADPGMRPALVAGVFLLWFQALIVVGWTAASGLSSWPVGVVSGALVLAGGALTARLVRSQNRLHAAYHAAGVRSPLPPRVRRTRRWRRAATTGGLVGAATAAGAVLLLGVDSPLLTLSLAVVTGLLGGVRAATESGGPSALLTSATASAPESPRS